MRKNDMMYQQRPFDFDADLDNETQHTAEATSKPPPSIPRETSPQPKFSELSAPKSPSTSTPPTTGTDFLKLAGEALSDLSKDLAAGKSETLVKYLATMGTFHRYSFSNIMLICIQRPDATHVAGFNTWKDMGRYVKKGEKGIGIIAPMVFGEKKDARQTSDNSEDKGPRIRFRLVRVFDVSQTDGEPLPEMSETRGDPGKHLLSLRKIVTERGIALSYEDIPGTTEGLSRGGAIVIQSGLPPAKDFSVLAHEYAHELLHKTDRRNQATKTKRETEAEAVAFVVSRAIGLDCGTQTSDYIQLYNGDEKTLSASLDLIQKTAAEILSELMPKKNKTNKED